MRTAAALALLAPLGCAAAGSSPGVSVPVIPPIADHTIVLGQRVGPISLGMSEAQLLAAGGQPVNVQSYGGNRTGYYFPALKIHSVIDTGRVVYVAPEDASYATAAGAHIGSTEADLGSTAIPAWRHTDHGHVTLCFADRTLVVFAGHTGSGGGDCTDGQICDIALGGCAPEKP